MVLRKGPRLTVTSGVTIIITDYRSSWLHGQRPAKRRKAKIWLTIAHSVNNFIRSELPPSKIRRATWHQKTLESGEECDKNAEPFYTTPTHALISRSKSLAKPELQTQIYKTYFKKTWCWFFDFGSKRSSSNDTVQSWHESEFYAWWCEQTWVRVIIVIYFLRILQCTLVSYIETHHQEANILDKQPNKKKNMK